MPFYVTIINYNDTPQLDATPYPTLEAAMDAVCMKPPGWVKDAWIERDGRREADLAKIKNHCPGQRLASN